MDELSPQENPEEKIIALNDMYQNYFLEYASYVILERAVPAIEDGLKPVQRRILHSMDELDDGRYNKVANVIGNTMKYHPHGDASINDAMVQIGQKDLLIDMQGNWGNILTGDSAAAARYIEARLTKFAKEVVFNPKTTNWQMSYDGRNREPVTFPMKFPLLLAQGVEGIAVGLACKIMPHNFIELIDASIDILKGKKTEILPDFPTGGLADFSRYNSGLRGGKIRCRAKISIQDAKTLVVTELPFSTTTGSLIDSILSAADKGKIKIKKIEDNTAEHVEIVIHLPPGISADQTLDALFAFTDCEISISPNACVIMENKPRFIGVDEILRISTWNTVDLLKLELEIRKAELMESILFTSLEKIFIENRIYRKIEECETWDEIMAAIDKGLKPFKSQFYREITRQDMERLTEIKIKRISRFDSFKADEILKGFEENLKEAEHHLEHLVQFAVDYFKELKKKYAKGRERKTEVRSFESIEATQVVARTEKLFVDYENGFAGYGLKGATYVSECSDIDEIIVFREDGTMMVSKVAPKTYIGKGILHVGIFRKDDDRTIYHLIYRDGPQGPIMMKRFPVKGVTRDKDYDLTKGTKGSSILHFSVNPNGESEVLTVYLKPRPKLKKQVFDFDLGTLAIKGRNSQGNILSKFPIRKIVSVTKGESTLSGIKYWYDMAVNRLNVDERGLELGEFRNDEKIITVTRSGLYKIVKPDITLHFDDDMFIIEKFRPEVPVTTVYFDPKKKEYYVKRFIPEVLERNSFFMPEDDCRLEVFSTDVFPVLHVSHGSARSKNISEIEIKISDSVPVRSEKAKGNKLSYKEIKKFEFGDPLPEPEPEVKKEDKITPSAKSNRKEIDLPDDDVQKSLF